MTDGDPSDTKTSDAPHPEIPALAPLPAVPPVAPRQPRRARRRHRRSGAISLVLTLFVLFGFAFGLLALSGKTLSLPVVAVIELEARLNARLIPGSGLPTGAAISIGGVEIVVGRDWVPHLALQDVRLLRPGEDADMFVLPEARLTFDGRELLQGRLQVQSVRLSGLRIDVRRDTKGAFEFALGATEGSGPSNLAELIDGMETILAGPNLGKLVLIEADALTLTLADARAGREWRAGDGRLSIRNDADGIAAELSLSVEPDAAQAPSDGAAFMPPAAQAVLRIFTSRADSSARIEAVVDQLPAADLAAQARPLFWLSVLDASISGRLTGGLLPDGSVAPFDGTLTLGQGALRPTPEAKPIGFDRAQIALGYDPSAARITLRELTVESPSLRLKSVGQSYVLNPSGRPIGPTDSVAQFLVQLQFSDMRVDPEGLFDAPVSFQRGAMDLRLQLTPFRIDLGQMSLVGDDERILVKGTASAGPGGWTAAIDLGLNQIEPDRLIKLWPETAVAKTRAWFAANVPAGRIFNLQSALRIVPGGEPRFSLAYEFDETEVRFLRTLPPILAAAGRATIEDNRQTLVLERGYVKAPKGGDIDMAGSVFTVPDLRQRPARAEVRLKTDSTLTAVLSILDEPPFRFLTNAAQPVELGDGRARFDATVSLPLVEKVFLPDVSYSAKGTISDFTSAVLVPKRILAAPLLQVDLTRQGLVIRGEGTLGAVPFDVAYTQRFAPDQKGRSRVEGTVTLSDVALRDIGIALPEGAVKGEAEAQVTLDLVRDEVPKVTLVSDLNRMALRLDALRWNKPAATLGRLSAEATLGPRPEITRLTLAAPGMKADGRITTRARGGLELARFDTLRVGEWLDVSVDLQGKGADRPPAIAITAGSLDLSKLPDAPPGASADGLPFMLKLDQLSVAQSISLTQFRGDFSSRGGLNGTFTALLNGKVGVRGIVVPGAGGSALRLVSDDAGGVLAAAGIFANGRGGALELQLTPREGRGRYDGRATFTNLRVQDAPVLAALLSAVSVVGLLEQLNGEGLFFNDGEVDFRISPDAVEITRGSAVGLSLGVSMAGLYDTVTRRIDLQGVVSPIYLVNGIGAIFSRKREGIFGFNYRLSGTADAPSVSVNPLSILTPGMFRDIFRQPPPRLEDKAG